MENKNLGQVFEFIRNGATIKQGIDGGFPITRIETISDGHININKMGYAGIFNYKEYEDYLLKEGDILMSHINSVKHLGKTAIFETSEKKIIHGMNLLCLRALRECLLSKYAYYFFNSIEFKKQLPKIIKNSVNQASFSISSIKKVTIPIPTLETQNKIVVVLDKAQELIDKRKEQIEKLDEFLQSVFLDMFGDPVKNPKGWEINKLDILAKKITDGTHHSPQLVERGIPYVTAKHLKETGLDFYSNPTYISRKDHQQIYNRCSPEKSDVLYIKDGVTTGIAGINIYDFQFSMLSSLALIKVEPTKIVNRYLVHYLNNSSVKKRVIVNMSGGAIKRLTLKKIKDIDIITPPLDLQNKFAEIVQKTEQQKELLKTSLTEMENNFNSLMQKAFKGKLF